jgi:CheY-like chemotaxis protein
MRRILFVDDDPLVVRIYQEALTRRGFEVETALDGVAATKALHANKPDLMVLDLMMPRLSGVDVLKFVRAEPDLASLPVIVLSNAYMDDLAGEAVASGAQKGLLKVRCTPSILIGVIRELLEGQPPSQDPVHIAAASATPEPQATLPVPRVPVTPAPRPPAPPPGSAGALLEHAPTDTDFRSKARSHFLETAPATSAALRSLFQAFARATNDQAERELRLQNLYRKVHFLTAGAGMAECYPIARMAGVFEAMLFELTTKRGLESASVMRTAAFALDVFDQLFQHARLSIHDSPPAAEILVVDDDALSNRLVVSALRHAQLQARSTENPFVALQWLREKVHDLVLLDIEMPGMDGFDLCKRLRQLPGYQHTPVIYVTGHTDFESRTRSALSGGDDLIAKPIFPMELAVKTMAHLLSSQMATKAPNRPNA